MPSRIVVFLVFDGALALDITGPAEVFALANRMPGVAGASYDIRVVSQRGGLVRTASGLCLHSDALAPMTAIDTLIVSGGETAHAVATDDALTAWISTAASRSRRVCSVCTGAYLLAAAGLLDGRRVATHWGAAARLRALYPRVNVDLEPIYIRDGNVWTSAGVTAGIDLALALVEADLGRAIAIEIAKELVVFLHRPGGQAQFSSALSAQHDAVLRENAGKLAALHAWMADNLGRPLSVEVLARQVGMSPRSFARLYAETMKLTPAKAVEMLRLEAAKRALERGGASIKAVAFQCGFGNEERLRRAFERRFNVSPSHYREHFGAAEIARDRLPGGSPF